MSADQTFTTSRLLRFGTSIFTEVSAAAAKYGAVNLGQGFPDFDGPDFVTTAAANAVKDGPNQYAPMGGHPLLTQAIAHRFQSDHAVEIDPEHEVTITAGCTEAIASSIQGIIEHGDEVIILEPWYDSYPAAIEMAGGVCRYLTLTAPDFRLKGDDLEACVSDRTRMIIINSPHNPTGRILDDQEREALKKFVLKHDLIIFSDEVYEHLYFEEPHRSLLCEPELRERTIVGSSIGKTFSLTGWKIGWTIASPQLTQAIRAAHQFLTFSIATPLQVAAAEALNAPDEYFTTLRAEYLEKRNLLCDGLEDVGLDVIRPQGTYFALVDHTSTGHGSDRAFCNHLLEKAGVAAIPVSAFHHDGHKKGGGGQNLTRFAFCKTHEVLEEALSRLRRL